MSEKNAPRHEAMWWSIELLDGWSVDVDLECTTFTSVEVKGVLQLSAYRKDSDIGEGELFELADEEPAPESVELGLCAGLCSTHDAEELRRKKWWLVKDRTLIFVTYNGPVRSADGEIRAIEKLLKTLDVRP